ADGAGFRGVNHGVGGRIPRRPTDVPASATLALSAIPSCTERPSSPKLSKGFPWSVRSAARSVHVRSASRPARVADRDVREQGARGPAARRRPDHRAGVRAVGPGTDSLTHGLGLKGLRAAGARDVPTRAPTARRWLAGKMRTLETAQRAAAVASSCTSRVPSTSRYWAIQAGCAGQAGAVTRFPSVTAWSIGTSTYSPPASRTSGPTAGYAETRRPLTTSAAVRTCAPWQIAATGLPASKKRRTALISPAFRRRD